MTETVEVHEARITDPHRIRTFVDNHRHGDTRTPPTGKLRPHSIADEAIADAVPFDDRIVVEALDNGHPRPGEAGITRHLQDTLATAWKDLEPAEQLLGGSQLRPVGEAQNDEVHNPGLTGARAAVRIIGEQPGFLTATSIISCDSTPGFAARSADRSATAGIEWLLIYAESISQPGCAMAVASVRRTLWRVFLRLRFRLWQHRRHDRLVLERDLGFPMVVLPGVFNPTLFQATGVLVDHLDRYPLPHGCSALDLGTGSGALAVAAARTAGRVVAVDINEEAVRCARLNLLLNRVDDRAEVRRSDLFESVAGMRFDRVLCNPPYYLGSPRTDLELAFYSDDFAGRFATALPDHLSDGGSALVVLSSEGDEAGFLAAFRAAALAVEEVDRQHPYGEVIRILRVSRGNDALSELP